MLAKVFDMNRVLTKAGVFAEVVIAPAAVAIVWPLTAASVGPAGKGSAT